MPRPVTAQDAERRRLWAAWLSERAAQPRWKSDRALARSLADHRGAPDLDLRQYVREWKNATRTVSADLAFDIGDVLRAEGFSESAGPVALFAAGYYGELALFLDALSSAGGSWRALALYWAIPALFDGDHAARNKALSILAASHNQDLFRETWEHRRASRDPLAGIAVEIARSTKDMSLTDVRIATGLVLSAWAQRLYEQGGLVGRPFLFDTVWLQKFATTPITSDTLIALTIRSLVRDHRSPRITKSRTTNKNIQNG